MSDSNHRGALPRLYCLECELTTLAAQQRAFHLGLAAFLVTRGLHRADDLTLHAESAQLLLALDRLRDEAGAIRRTVAASAPPGHDGAAWGALS